MTHGLDSNVRRQRRRTSSHASGTSAAAHTARNDRTRVDPQRRERLIANVVQHQRAAPSRVEQAHEHGNQRRNRESVLGRSADPRELHTAFLHLD